MEYREYYFFISDFGCGNHITHNLSANTINAAVFKFGNEIKIHDFFLPY